MSVGSGGVAFGVGGHEVVAYVSFECGGVGAGPGVCCGDGGDARDGGFQVLGQADEGVTFGYVVAALNQLLCSNNVRQRKEYLRSFHILDIGLSAPDNFLVTGGWGDNMIVTSALCADRRSSAVKHVVYDPWGIIEDQIISSAAEVNSSLFGRSGDDLRLLDHGRGGGGDHHGRCQSAESQGLCEE